MDLGELFKNEILVLKRAPLIFVVGFLALGFTIFGAEYQFIFKELLAHKDYVIQEKDNVIRDKDSLIQDMEKKLATAGEVAQRPAPDTPAKPSIQEHRFSVPTGSARVDGTGNAVNTGSMGNVRIDASNMSPEKK